MAIMKTAKGLEFLVDDEDVPLLSQYIWNLRQANYARSTHFGRSVFVHRLVMGMDHTDKRVVDHISGNTLDNRKSNLRACTIKENVRSRPKGKLNTSGFKGVFKYGHNYVSKITVDSKCLNLGHYPTAIEAAQAYDIAALKHFKEFAWPNFPREKYSDPGYLPPRKNHDRERYINRINRNLSSTGERNIYFMSKKQNYRVSIMIYGKKYVLGHFKDLCVAMIVRDNFLNDPHGPYQAQLNIIRDAS